MRNSLFKFKSYAFVLLLSLSLFSVHSNDDDSLPEVEIADKEKWLDRVNGDIISLRNARFSCTGRRLYNQYSDSRQQLCFRVRQE